MADWEYKVEPVFNQKRTEDVLNSLADEGWELVIVAFPGPSQQFKDHGSTAHGPWLFLKREKRQEGA
jgi:Domain of unknown function (DUF4177)